MSRKGTLEEELYGHPFMHMVAPRLIRMKLAWTFASFHSAPTFCAASGNDGTFMSNSVMGSVVCFERAAARSHEVGSWHGGPSRAFQVCLCNYSSIRAL